jgi:hypothetical protein
VIDKEKNTEESTASSFSSSAIKDKEEASSLSLVIKEEEAKEETEESVISSSFSPSPPALPYLILAGMACCKFRNNTPDSASAADAITALMSCTIFSIALLSAVYFPLFDKKQ